MTGDYPLRRGLLTSETRHGNLGSRVDSLVEIKGTTLHYSKIKTPEGLERIIIWERLPKGVFWVEDVPEQKVPLWTIYCLTDHHTKKRYVGMTKKPLETRWRAHLVKSKRGKSPLAVALRNRKKTFKRRVLSIALNSEVAQKLERFWIGELKTLSPGGYNLTSGGAGSFQPAPEVRQKIAAANRKRGTEFFRKMGARGTENRWGFRNPTRVDFC